MNSASDPNFYVPLSLDPIIDPSLEVVASAMVAIAKVTPNEMFESMTLEVAASIVGAVVESLWRSGFMENVHGVIECERREFIEARKAEKTIQAEDVHRLPARAKMKDSAP